MVERQQERVSAMALLLILPRGCMVAVAVSGARCRFAGVQTESGDRGMVIDCIPGRNPNSPEIAMVLARVQ